MREKCAQTRILHCPRNIGGHSSTVSQAEHSLGAYSRLILIEAERYGFGADEILTAPGDSAYKRWAAKLKLLQRALQDFDVVHFNGGQPLFGPPPPWFWSGMKGPLRSKLAHGAFESLSSLAPFLDLKLLRKKEKLLCVTFQGDDARQGAPQRARYMRSLATEADGIHYSLEGDLWKRQRVAAFSQHAHLIYALNPDLLRDLPERARFLPYAIDASSIDRQIRDTSNRLPLIVHAPSDQRVKGTRFVLAAIDSLRASGVNFEFVLLENRNNKAARQVYARADIIIDQLNAGFYGMLAVEAMAVGKAVVAFMREDDLTFLDSAMRRECPVISAEPETLHGVLDNLLRYGPGLFVDIGRAGRTFVARWHDSKKVAARLLSDYDSVSSKLFEKG